MYYLKFSIGQLVINKYPTPARVSYPSAQQSANQFGAWFIFSSTAPFHGQPWSAASAASCGSPKYPWHPSRSGSCTCRSDSRKPSLPPSPYPFSGRPFRTCSRSATSGDRQFRYHIPFAIWRTCCDVTGRHMWGCWGCRRCRTVWTRCWCLHARLGLWGCFSLIFICSKDWLLDYWYYKIFGNDFGTI